MAESDQEKKWRAADAEIRTKLPPGLKLVGTLRGHTDAVANVVWSPDGKILASAGSDQTIHFHLWDAQSIGWPHGISGNKDLINCVAFNATGDTLAGGSEDGKVRQWEVANGTLLRTFGGGHMSSRVWCIAFNQKSGTLAAGREDGVVTVWNPRARAKLLHTLYEHRGAVISMAYDATGRILATGGLDRTICLWKAGTDKLLRTLEGHEDAVTSVAFDPRGGILASGSADQTIKLWDVASGKLLRTLEGHTTPVRAVSFAPGGRCLASGGRSDGVIRLWNPDSGACLATTPELYWGRSPISGLAFHPHLPLLATVGSDPNAPVWLRDCVIHLYELDFSVLSTTTNTSTSISYTSAKIVLVGDSGVGKTGLGWRLAHGEFKEHASTHGQQFWLLNQPYAGQPDGTQREIVLWDLAGQSDYRLIHALFLDDTDVALVLFDPTHHDDPLSGVSYWLKQLKIDATTGGTSAVLVASRTDRGAPRLVQAELEAFCQQRGIKAYVATSAKGNVGIPELLEKIYCLIPWEKKPQTVTTETFKRIKDFVLRFKEDPAHKEVILLPKQLRARLEATDSQWSFTDAEMLTAVGHLSNHGYVTRLKTSRGEPRLLLAPELLNNLAASFILEARRNPKGLGALEEDRLLTHGYPFPELKDLSDKEKEILLDSAAALFLERNVCFREIDPLNGRAYLVFPELINLKRPSENESKPVEDGVAYTVAGSVENVYASLVVLMGYTQNFTRTDQWQNYARYEMHNKRVCGFRLEAERAGELDFAMFFGTDVAAPARTLFQSLFESFLSNRNLSVQRYEPVVCPNSHVLNRVVVRARISSGAGFAFCSDCGTRVSVPKSDQPLQLSKPQAAEVATDRRVADQRSRFEGMLFRLKSYITEMNIRPPLSFISYAWDDAEQERWVEKSLATDLQKAGIKVVLDRWENMVTGSSIPRFVERLAKCNFIIVVGTPSYRKKYENEDQARGSIVGAEGDLIGKRMLGTESEKKTVLPVLLQGSEDTAFPHLLQGRTYADFRLNEAYFEATLDLLLDLYNIGRRELVATELRISLHKTAL